MNKEETIEMYEGYKLQSRGDSKYMLMLFKQLKKDGNLINLKGYKNITTVEAEYIRQLLAGEIKCEA